MSKFFSLLFSIIIFFSWVINLSAHPLDISNTYLSISWVNKIDVTTYFHPYEISYLLKDNSVDNSEKVETYFENSDKIINYLEENISIKNNNSNCKLTDATEVLKDPTYEILANWLRVNYHFICPSEISKLSINIDFFTEFDLQTNKVTVSRMLDDLYFKVLTPRIKTLELDINNINYEIKDSDDDWLSDEEELIYKTSPTDIDTDWDEFTDKEEIDNWRNPLNPDFSPWQDKEPKREEGYLANMYSQSSTASWKEKGLYENSQYLWSWFLKDTLKEIDDFLSWKSSNFFIVFFMVMTLWIIHAIWPWHSKSLLISYVLEDKKKIYDWIFYSLVFSIIHILDILFLYVLYLLSSNFIDYSWFTWNITFYSWIILVLLSIYLFFSKVVYHKKCSDKSSKNSWIMTAVIAWLMPCSFWWSIFILLVTIWQTWWILPLIIALWLWIFLTLATISILTVKLKDKMYSKIQVLSKYSLILSISIIFIVWISMVLKTSIF